LFFFFFFNVIAITTRAVKTRSLRLKREGLNGVRKLARSSAHPHDQPLEGKMKGKKRKVHTGEENPRELIRYICHTFTASHMLIHRQLSLSISFYSYPLDASRCD